VKLTLERIHGADRVLLAALAVLAALNLILEPGALLALVRLLLYTVGLIAGIRLLHWSLRKVIWRVRNRLLVAYLFIAIVPIALISVLVAVAASFLLGQFSVYLVAAELERRTSALVSTAGFLAEASPQAADAWVGRTAFLRERFPELELVVEGSTRWVYPPSSTIQSPAGWDEAKGLVLRDGLLYLWANTVREGSRATVMVPLTHEFLGDLVPDLGEVSLVTLDTGPDSGRSLRLPRAYATERGSKNRLPPQVYRVDPVVADGTPVPVAIWEQPGRMENDLLRVRARVSSIVNTIFSQRAEVGGAVILAVVVASVALLIAELVSVIIGVKITRTITSAVHDLYGGTERVMHGEFSHRIPVNGNDQLAELSQSFNRMTENVERLLEISKEKERLQSEIEIAREVQNQLYPKTVPQIRTLRLTAHCNPARMVSGDYYDYQTLDDGRITLAVGDVAGKGISAALLMATVQASLRTQLRACMESAAAAGNGGARVIVSTSRLVSQLNQQLHAHTSPEKFATFYFGVYDDRTGVLTYTNAGHLPPILLRRGEPLRLEVNGMVVGAFPFSRYGESLVQLESGDLLICYTDGVTEPENEYGEMFGEQRLIEVLTKNDDRENEAIVAAVLDAVQQFTGSPELQDDMTLLLARRQ
jgi:sigma-B regulation protein RsbU (phosphoserine phosphatase)